MKTSFNENLKKLVEANIEKYNTEDLINVLGIENGRDLMNFGREIKEKNLGRYYPSDGTAEYIELYTDKCKEYLKKQTIENISSFADIVLKVIK